MKASLSIILVTAAICVALSVVTANLWPVLDAPKPSPDGPQRVIVLMPPITETVFALGGGNRVIGASDYDKFPKQVSDRPRCGTAITPNVERITELRPDLILVADDPSTSLDKLRKLGPVRALKWDGGAQIAASIRELGGVLGATDAAEEIAKRFDALANAEADPSAKTVLLAMAHEPGKLSSVWYFKRNCLHGEALRLIGYRNAVDWDVDGAPNLRLERVVDLDPDLILVVSASEDVPEATRTAILADWRELGLRAKIGFLNGDRFFATGPRLPDAAQEIHAKLQAMERQP